MDWSNGANFYLLKAVDNYGLDWPKVSSMMEKAAKTFLTDENCIEFSEKSCSLQYNYIIATTRQKNEVYQNKTDKFIMQVALDHYISVRKQYLLDKKMKYMREIEQSEQDFENLLAGKFVDVSPERLMMYRKRCRAMYLPDFIANILNLPKLNADPVEDEKIKQELNRGSRSPTSAIKCIEDEKGGTWIPISENNYDALLDFSPPKPKEPRLAAELFDCYQFIDVHQYRRDVDEQGSNFVTPPLMVSSGAPGQSGLTPQPNHMPSPIGVTVGHRGPESQSRPISPGGSSVASDVGSSAASLKNAGQTKARSRTKSQLSHGEPDSPNLASSTGRISSLYASTDFTPSQAQSALTLGRRWRRNLLSALSTVCNHRHAHVFMAPVTDEIAPGYSKIVRRPMDLGTMRKRIEAVLAPLAGTTSAAQSSPTAASSPNAVIVEAACMFIRDLLLMFSNARMYNSSSHQASLLSTQEREWDPQAAERAGKVRDVTGEAVWCLSSCKAGYGIEQLLDNRLNMYWQSDGPQPHLVTIQFSKRTWLSALSIYVDYQLDESYTPSKFAIRCGDTPHSLYEILEVELPGPVGWRYFPIEYPDKYPVKTFILQLAMLSNHQNGRDTHIRGIRVHSPKAPVGYQEYVWPLLPKNSIKREFEPYRDSLHRFSIR